MLQILQQIKGIVDDDDDDAEPDYDVLSDVTQKQQQQPRDDMCVAITSNPDVISCGGGGGGGESQRSRPYNCSNKTLRSAFVKRYNALSKRSAKNKSQRRPGLQQVFDNAAFHRDHVWTVYVTSIYWHLTKMISFIWKVIGSRLCTPLRFPSRQNVYINFPHLYQWKTVSSFAEDTRLRATYMYFS